MDRKVKFTALEALFDAGYRDETAIKNYPMEEIGELNLNKGEEFKAVAGIKKAARSRKLISYLAEDEDEKEGDAKAAGSGKSKAAVPQKEVISRDDTKHSEAPIQVPGNSKFLHEKGLGKTNDSY